MSDTRIQRSAASNRRREGFFTLIVIALFTCLMGSIWLWLTGNIRAEREQMWQDVLSTTARDVSSDLENGVANASNRLLAIAGRLEREGGPADPQALEHVFSSGFIGLLNEFRIYTPESDLRANGVRRPDRVWYQRFSRLFASAEPNPPLDCPNCLPTPGGRVIIGQPVRQGNRVVAYVTAQYDVAGQIRNWEKKIDFRHGLLCLVNRKSEVLFFAGEEAQPVYGPLIGDPNHRLTQHIEKAEPGFEYIGDIAGVPPAYAVTSPMAHSYWQVVIVVPEKTVGGGRTRSNIVRAGALALLFLAGVVFFFLVCKHYYSKTRQSRRNIDRLGFVIEAERMLFSAATDTAKVESSLQHIAEMLNARGIMFKVYPADDTPLRVFCRHRDPAAEAELRQLLKGQYFIRRIFANGENEFIAVGREQVAAQLRQDVQRTYVPETVCAVPIRDRDGTLLATLAVLDTDSVDTTMDMLHSVKLSFAGFLSTLRAYDKVRRMGERDALTGLLNRHSFEAAAASLSLCPGRTLHCVYADANGLHELNNTLGHEAGDRLIIATGRGMQQCFGDAFTFRTGGDEFVSLIPNGTAGITAVQMRDLQKSLAAQGFRCAFGCAALSETEDFGAMLRLAEQRMFADKQSDGRDHRHRYDREGSERDTATS